MCTTRLRAVQKTRGKAWRYSEASATPAWSRRRLHRRLLLRGKGGASSLRADPEPARRSTTQCSRGEGASCLRECKNERGKWAGRRDQRAEWAARVVSEPLAHRPQRIDDKGGHDYRVGAHGVRLHLTPGTRGDMVGLVTGLAIGYYLGSKAGRERYEQLQRWFRDARKSGPVQKAQAAAGPVVEQIRRRTEAATGT